MDILKIIHFIYVLHNRRRTDLDEAKSCTGQFCLGLGLMWPEKAAMDIQLPLACSAESSCGSFISINRDDVIIYLITKFLFCQIIYFIP